MDELGVVVGLGDGGGVFLTKKLSQADIDIDGVITPDTAVKLGVIVGFSVIGDMSAASKLSPADTEAVAVAYKVFMTCSSFVLLRLGEGVLVG